MPQPRIRNRVKLFDNGKMDTPKLEIDKPKLIKKIIPVKGNLKNNLLRKLKGK
jgi:hypothetical protein